MDTEHKEYVKQEWERVNSLVDTLTLFDDELMGRVFDKNTQATELVLRLILGRNIKVISVNGQEEIRNAKVGGRNIILDVHAIDVAGEEMNIEVQGGSEGAHVRRARYHSSMLDTGMLKESQPLKELKDSYVIFIYKRDKFGKGLPLYHVDRYIKETEETFGDGSHIIYVNGSYNGDDAIGKLVSDFHQTDSEQMYYSELADGVEHYKETEKGRGNMSEAVEKYAREYAEECVIVEKITSVKNLMKNMKLTLEQALNALGIPDKDREQIINQLQK
jgi:hypothetical protein